MLQFLIFEWKPLSALGILRYFKFNIEIDGCVVYRLLGKNGGGRMIHFLNYLFVVANWTVIVSTQSHREQLVQTLRRSSRGSSVKDSFLGHDCIHLN